MDRCNLHQVMVKNKFFNLTEEKIKFPLTIQWNIPFIIDLGINKIHITLHKNFNAMEGDNIIELFPKEQKPSWNNHSKLKTLVKDHYKNNLFYPTLIKDQCIVDYQWNIIGSNAHDRENHGKRLSCIIKNKENVTLMTDEYDYCSELLGNIIESLWSYNYKSNKESKTFILNLIITHDDDFISKLIPVFHRTESIFLMKYLGFAPSNILHPKSFADYIHQHFKNSLVKVQIFGEKAMEQMGMGALLAIGQGSNRESQMVIMEYGHGPKILNFIGKGVTFDTGGSNLKLGHFYNMKFDMMGSATVFGIMDLFNKNPQWQEEYTVLGAIGLVENQIGGNAILPNEVVSTIEGKTIEILNTDAEGRVVLADVIGYCKKYLKDKWDYSRDTMILFATLTGSVVECLSDSYAGLFSNNNNLAHSFMKAGEDSADLCWMMPCNSYYNYVWENSVADIGNIHNRKGGGSIKGAKFLEYFIGDKIQFAYFDIAGVADCIGRLNSDHTATGYGIKLIHQWLVNNK